MGRVSAPAPATGAETAAVDPLVRTYVFLRVSLIAAVLLLGASLVVQISATGELLISISRYYYTPVMSVFVGALVGMGFALIALVGRPGPEDTALNFAGMLAPVVAFVPTPIDGTVPEAFVQGVANNIAALLVVGLLVLVFAVITARRLGSVDRWARWGLVVASGVWIGVVIWFGFGEDWPPRASFLQFAHYGAAIPMFVSIIVVVFINAFQSQSGLNIAGRTVTYKPFYGWIAGLMAVSVVAGVAWWLITREDETAPPVIFWVEAALLILFMLFWALQTWEFRRTGLPPEAKQSG